MFYAKRAVRKVVPLLLDASLSGFKILTACLLLASLVVIGERAWIKRIEDNTIANTFFIKSLPDAVRQGSATGFAVKSPTGKVYTLTNAHVCQLANPAGFLSIQGPRSARAVPRRVLEIFQDNDLCLVEGMEGYEGLEIAIEYFQWSNQKL